MLDLNATSSFALITKQFVIAISTHGQICNFCKIFSLSRAGEWFRVDTRSEIAPQHYFVAHSRGRVETRRALVSRRAMMLGILNRCG